MGVDIFQISHGLMNGISRLFSAAYGRGMRLGFGGRIAMLFLQILQDAP